MGDRYDKYNALTSLFKAGTHRSASDHNYHESPQAVYDKHGFFLKPSECRHGWGVVSATSSSSGYAQSFDDNRCILCGEDLGH